MFTSIMDALIGLAVVISEGVFLLLPDTPFKFEPIEWGSFGKALGYFVPIKMMAGSFALLLLSIGGYYAIRTILRWIKMVQ